MKVIWKYVLPSRCSQIELPLNAIPCAFKIQGVMVVIYFEIDPNEKQFEQRTVLLYHTGEEFQRAINSKYVGTALTDNDSYVLHCYVV